jgi:hypothetical protein
MRLKQSLTGFFEIHPANIFHIGNIITMNNNTKYLTYLQMFEQFYIKRR